jgi:hypothetical protein
MFAQVPGNVLMLPWIPQADVLGRFFIFYFAHTNLMNFAHFSSKFCDYPTGTGPQVIYNTGRGQSERIKKCANIYVLFFP